MAAALRPESPDANRFGHFRGWHRSSNREPDERFSDRTCDVSEPSDLQRRIASLTPERRAMLERWLVESRPTTGRAPGIPRRPPSRTAPLSHAQQRLWVLQQLQPELIAYNMPRIWRLSGAIDVPALSRTLDALVERHEVLRTTYRHGDPEPVQVIAENVSVDMPVVDVTGLDADAREAEMMRRVAEEARRPFDLASPPVLRAMLVRMGPEEHVLLVANHHICSDGWSVGIMVREMSALYAAFSEGREPTLPPLPVQYADFAVWQRGWLEGPALRDQLAYWRERLTGAPPELELPADRPRPHEQSYRGSRQLVMMPSALAEAVRALSRAERATPFMTLLTAFYTLLFRHTGQPDLVVGTAIAGRTRIETEPLIGFFVNTLALRGDCSGDPTFRELLARVRSAALSAYANQDVPFEKLVHELRPERRLDRSPLVQVMFVLQDGTRSELVMPGVTVSPVELEARSAQFDLSLSVTDTPVGLSVRAEYSSDLFDASTVARFLGHYQRVLEGAVADPARRISAIPILSAPERRQALVEWNAPRPGAGDVSCLHALFEAQAARRPDAVAVSLGAERLTYGDLNARANRLAGFLRRAGVGPDVLVGICLEPSLDLIVGLLAILKAGGAYLPLDPAYPADRLAFMMDDARIATLLTERRHVDRLPPGRAPVICMDDGLDAAESDVDPKVEVDPHNLAYVIYTSGSSGRPKGTLVTHSNVSRLLDATRHWFEFGEGDVWTLFHSYAFDFSVWEMWGALAYGGRLVVVPYLTSRSPAEFHALLRAEGVTVLNQTPSAFRQLIAADGEAERGGRGLALRAVIFGGEALPLESLLPWVERHGDRAPRLINMYGITETTVHVTYRPLGADEIRRAGGSVIGAPIPDLQLYVLDRAMEPVPIGVAGEIYVGGAGLARGYLDRPDLTAERFLPDPFAAQPGRRLYRTGDLARRLADGDVEYLGRADHQVKLRGYRIELGEIEAALRGLPGVSDVAVDLRQAGSGDARLVAYLVFTGARLTPAEMRAALRQGLPEYMVPAAFVPLAVLPLTPTGKLDRRALPAPDPAALEPAEPAAAIEDPLVRELAVIWARVLRVPTVGLRDNFFDLGGHSLLAVRLMAEVERRWRQRLPLVALFRAPTVTDMAALLRGDGGAAPASTLVAIQPAGHLPPLFCVPEHTGTVLCFEQLARHLAPDQPVYGLEPLGLDGRRAPQTRIEDMATHYLEEVRAVQPAGPYFLAGYCFGGLVAFEMAQQLHARGEAVALLAVFNTYGPERRASVAGLSPLRRFAVRSARRLHVERENMRVLTLGEKLRYLLAQTSRVRARLRGRLDRARARQADLAPHLTQVVAAHDEAFRAYTPRPYAGDLTLFWSQHRFARSFVDPSFGWRPTITGKLDVHLIPARTGSVIQDPEAVPLAAAELRQLVQQIAMAQG